MEKKNTWVWVIVGILVLVGIWYFVTKNPKTPEPVVQDDAIASDTIGPESVQDTTNVAGIPAQPVISYAKALIQYADRRIQLDATCQAHPNNVTYKDNTGIMIDNRSEFTRTVKVGTTFTIKPYGFKIVVLPDVYRKSSTLLVDCDKSQNVATILVQE
jgi:hypothetical protein